MADYIYTMETRLTPEQQRGVALVQELSAAHGFTLYLTGGAMRDIISGFPIRDLDFTIHGNAVRLQKDLEKAGALVEAIDEEINSLLVLLPGKVRSEIAMARSETFSRPGKPPEIRAATIVEDLRRRDFTCNAMALSLNPGSRGLLHDPANGVADIEAKVIRILHNYSFLEEPSRLIRATRFAARFHWILEERTRARYDAAHENNYIEHISSRAVGHEIEQLAYEEDPLHVLRALEKEGWLKALCAHWTVAKVDTSGLSQLLKTRQLMADCGYAADPAPAVFYFLTRRLPQKEQAAMQRLIARRPLVEQWRRLGDEAQKLSARLSGKEAATPSRAWRVLSESRPETILFLEVSGRKQAVRQKIRNFFGKWRQLKQRLPFLEMAELHITPALPEYKKILEDAFPILLDGRLRSRHEILRYLKPFVPPPPVTPPPPPRRARTGRGAAPAAATRKSAKKDAVAGLPAAVPALPTVAAGKMKPSAPAVKSTAAHRRVEKKKASKPRKPERAASRKPAKKFAKKKSARQTKAKKKH